MKSAWTAAKKILTIYLEYEDAPEDVADSGNRKGKQPKESIQQKQKKEKVEKTEKDGND